MLLPFAVVFFLAYRPLRDLGDARLALARASGAAEELARLEDAVDERTPVIEAVDASPPAWSLAPLVIDGLALARGDVDDVSLRAEAGAIVCIVGPTGVGKTTLLRTLLGLDVARGGHVRYGARDVTHAAAGPRARPFAWVPQDAPLLADTLDANVGLGGATDATEALGALGAAHLVDALGASRLGAGGRAVSGGERQWIALARAVAGGQPVLLLDEPTSGLDAASQARVLDAIARLRGRRTVILVTHRPEPLAIADAVVRLGGSDAADERAALA
jgi:ABC-type transport system involved in cytochrome bd biosynthesis fused ATPase/permease subunit